MRELDRILNDLSAWVTTADGNQIRRDDYLDLLIEEVHNAYMSPLERLHREVMEDKRKSFGKSSIIELIEEYM